MGLYAEIDRASFEDLHSPNPRHREYACDVVGDEGLSAQRNDVAALLDDPDVAVRQAAAANLPASVQDAR